MIFLQLFLTFFKIGLFGFGGGYAMLSLIQAEVVSRYGWISSSEFTDIVAVSQMTPGPIGINSATYVGYTAIINSGLSPTWAIMGSTIATLAVVLPSFVIMILASKLFLKYQKHPLVESLFGGLRPAIVGLLAAAALSLMNANNFGSYQTDAMQLAISLFLFIATFIASRYYKVSPILLIVLCGAAGYLLYAPSIY
ncbi:MAG: chromate transporter [Phocaeicola sp.]